MWILRELSRRSSRKDLVVAVRLDAEDWDSHVHVESNGGWLTWCRYISTQHALICCTFMFELLCGWKWMLWRTDTAWGATENIRHMMPVDGKSMATSELWVSNFRNSFVPKTKPSLYVVLEMEYSLLFSAKRTPLESGGASDDALECIQNGRHPSLSPIRLQIWYKYGASLISFWRRWAMIWAIKL